MAKAEGVPPGSVRRFGAEGLKDFSVCLKMEAMGVPESSASGAKGGSLGDERL